jgi:hypothetical protein
MHRSGMLVVEDPEHFQYLCIPEVSPGQAEFKRYGLKLLQDDLIFKGKRDPFRLPEAQEFLNSWDGTELMMPVTIVTPARD